jgi:ATP-dependent protease ClpP protease subunit
MPDSSNQTKDTMDNELDMDFMDTSKGRIRAKVTSRVHEFYISGTIKESSEYIEWFDTIRHASPEDTIKIYINSYGGDMFTGIQFMRVLSETEALVVCSVEGACMSAATMIFLCADQFEVTPHSMFMFHNYSGGTIGKGGEIYDQVRHERKWSEKLLKEIYEGFLTDTEIQSLLDNRDMWMDVDEVIVRMGKRSELLKELAELDEATRPDEE